MIMSFQLIDIKVEKMINYIKHQVKLLLYKTGKTGKSLYLMQGLKG